MLLLLLLSFLLLFFVNVRINDTKDCNNNFLNRDFTNQIRGIAILAILMSHLINMLYFSRESTISVIKFIFCVFAPVGVGLFFFLSGYGNLFSMVKHNNIKWLGQKVFRLYITIFPVIIIQYILSRFLLLDLYTKTSVISNFLTLTIPPFTMWYLKVQAVAYICLYLCYKLFNKNCSMVLFFITFIYIIYCITNAVVGMWWVSTMCFPLGVLFAQQKERILSKLSLNSIKIAIIMFICSAILFLLVIPLKTTATFWLCLTSCILMSLLSLLITLKSKILRFLGNYSLEIYCVHLALISVLEKININIYFQKNCKIIFIIILTMLLVSYLKMFCDKVEKIFRESF